MASLDGLPIRNETYISQELKIRVENEFAWNRIEGKKNVSMNMKPLPPHEFGIFFHQQVNGALQTLVPVGKSLNGIICF